MLQSQCKLVVNTRVLGKLVWSIFQFTIILNFKFTRHMTNNRIMQIQSTSSKQVPPWWDEVEAADICSALTRKEMPLGNGPFLYIPSRVMKSIYMGEEIRLIYTESKNYRLMKTDNEARTWVDAFDNHVWWIEGECCKDTIFKSFPLEQAQQTITHPSQSY